MINNVINFENFLKKSFHSMLPSDQLINSWHISLISGILEQAASGDVKRLIFCMPPRYMKSICISAAFPAWLIGVKPTSKVIVASYAMPLAEKLSHDTKTIVESDWYRKMFPSVVWSKSFNTKKKFITNQGGFRMATSVNGSLTGEGADFLIADDPQKPLDVLNLKYRDRTHNWFLNTFLSRLNNKKNGVIILVMQRLHNDDLVSRLTDGKINDDLVQEHSGWKIINIAAMAKQDDNFRKKGEVINKKTDDILTFTKMKEQMGKIAFESQYQQSPPTMGSGVLKKESMHFVNSHIQTLVESGIFISVDTAFKCGIDNDATAISLWVESMQGVVLFDVINKKMEFNEVLLTIKELMSKFCVHKVLVEDKGSGTSVIQTLQQDFGSIIEGIQVRQSKEIRFYSSIFYFENKNVMIHKNISQEALEQLLTFPNTKHDDIVDSVSQFINWYFIRAKQLQIEPIIRTI